ncbi:MULTISPECIES: hypothetical protein [unclassified Streptomyces]|uniref:hypothetical protein n=1 Tax=unclassified Streptomyces TaxID=2593676 RepID=UPI00225160EB|nr:MULTISPECIES: hypothetical protein [unclassified Streptomyces]MCX4527259.1 hypothetical protein [Streptomyces sp. NBC_01551]MCX4542161.1 hypothetical protein [Streptomyces sp. NBC_01565]
MITNVTSRIAAAVAGAAAFALLSPAPAHATAAGSTPVATFDYPIGGVTMKVPTGCMFTHIIRGEGRKITYQNAGVDCGFVGALNAGFCNWRIDFTYADTNNKTYRTSSGKTHTECEIHPMRNNAPQTLPRFGKACAHLHINGVRRVSQCHHITK